MPNANYVKGRKKEYKVCKELREEGFDIVQRTAGSHSPVDILAIHKTKQLILLVQSKPDSYTEEETNRLLIKERDLNGEFAVVFEVR